MKKEFKVKGFPELISKEIEIPNMGELLNMQFTHLCRVDDFYKYGNEFQRQLIDNTPILGKMSEANIGVTFAVQYLFPGTVPIPDKMGFAEEWHMDYNIAHDDESSPYRNHLLLSECECLTEFNEREFTIDLEKENIKQTGDLNFFACQNSHLLKPRRIQPNRIYSFDSHIHRAMIARRPQFRLMFRLVESFTAPIKTWDKAIQEYGAVGRGQGHATTIQKTGKEIILDHSSMDNSYYNGYDEKMKMDRDRLDRE